MKKTIERSCFTKTDKCTECDWFLVPINPARSVCPACGGDLKKAVGDYDIITEKSWFSENISYDNFKERR